MAENTLPDAITELMKSPEIMNILSSLRGEGQQEQSAENIPETGNFSLPPEIAAKLLPMMAALSGAAAPQKSEKKEPEGGTRRNTLLRALRPYLNPRRQSALDSLIKLDCLSGLFGSFSETGGGGK